MLDRLRVQGFKSLREVDVPLPRLGVLFGPNAAGKSNVLDAVQLLSRIASTRTVSDALDDPIRGQAIEAFSFSSGGLPGLLKQERASLTLEADLRAKSASYRYRIALELSPRSGSLAVADEYLTPLDSKSHPKHTAPIEVEEARIRVRSTTSGKPRYEPLRQNFAQLSDPRLGGEKYRKIEDVRTELSSWRTYYLDPRVSMRRAAAPAEVNDIGILGDDIGPYLYRLRAEHPRHYAAIDRTLRTLIPSIEALSVDLDERRGTLDILIRQDGVDFSTRVISEGTLRVLARCAIAANPWGGALLAFEEPENGVHPRRIELIASLLYRLAADQKKQVLVTTHSPLFCEAVLRLESEEKSGIASLLHVRQRSGQTVVEPLDVSGPLFQSSEVRDRLKGNGEDGYFQDLVVRGLLDA